MAQVPERFTLYAQPLPEMQLPAFGLTKRGVQSAVRTVLGRWNEYYRIVPLERPTVTREISGELIALVWAGWRLSIQGENPVTLDKSTVWREVYLVPQARNLNDEDVEALRNLWFGFTAKGSRGRSKAIVYRGLGDFLGFEIETTCVPLTPAQ